MAASTWPCWLLRRAVRRRRRRRCVTCMAWYGWWCIGVTWSHIPILSKKDVDVGVKAVHLLLYSPGPGGVGPLVAPSMTTMLDPAMIGLAASKVQA